MRLISMFLLHSQSPSPCPSLNFPPLTQSMTHHSTSLDVGIVRARFVRYYL